MCVDPRDAEAIRGATTTTTIPSTCNAPSSMRKEVSNRLSVYASCERQ